LSSVGRREGERCQAISREEQRTSGLDDDEAVGEVVEVGYGDAAFGPGFEGGAVKRAE
jgi:hypothetical protein